MFQLDERHLHRLCHINSFPIPDDKYILFGLRGCLPVNEDDNSFSNNHAMNLAPLDYLHPRCSILIWQPGDSFAVFPGSTVPNKRNIKKAARRAGQGANQLMPSLLTNYFRGQHKKGRSTGHDALRQEQKLPVRRTSNDLIYDNLDPVDREVDQPQFDNIHSAWCGGLESRYASAGCQVVIGYPKCTKRGNRPDAGPWKSFIEVVYGDHQESFSYILLNGRDASKAANSEKTKLLSGRLRYGSQGAVVKIAQKKLQKEGFYKGFKVDGDFGMKMLGAVLDFQTEVFGPESDDGVIGPQTAAELAINWPEF